MGPLFPLGLIGDELNMLIGFIIGIGFGFLLEAAGFTNTRKLAGVFYGYDFVVLKVFFSAAITAAIGLFLMNHYGLIDIKATFYPKTFWIPTLVGGFIMAFGFIIGGFCPGTSICAAVTGKIDAMVFVLGAIIGIFGYAFTYESIWEDLRNSGAMGRVNIAEWIGVSDGTFILLLTIVAAIAFFAVSVIQKKVTEKNDYQL
ncbi:MAG: YeeE/YedE family protein [Bacteroidales bacterium]|nr:YeeE/YedE family protein [Bacteroidales bacterium]